MFYDEEPRNQWQPYLRPGERLLWAAKPDCAHFARLRWPMVLFGIPWTAITLVVSGGFIFGMFFAKEASFPGPLKPLILLFFVPFWAIGLFALGGHKFFYRRAWRRTGYALTDQNIVILQPTFFSVREVRVPLREIENITIERFRGNLGSVSFTGIISGWNTSENSRTPQHPQIESIPDVDRFVESARQVYEAKRAAEAQKQE